MIKKVHKLLFKPEYDFLLIGISSHENDYRISWAINKFCGLKLVKDKDHCIVDNRYPDSLVFSQFIYNDEDSILSYRLIANRCMDGFLIGEMRNIDYFFLIQGEISTEFTADLTKKISKLSMVNAAFQIDPNKLKSKQRLLI